MSSPLAAVFSSTSRVVLGPSSNTGALFATSVSPSATETFVNVDNDRDFVVNCAGGATVVSYVISDGDNHLIVGLRFIVQCIPGYQPHTALYGSQTKRCEIEITGIPKIVMQSFKGSL